MTSHEDDVAVLQENTLRDNVTTDQGGLGDFRSEFECENRQQNITLGAWGDHVSYRSSLGLSTDSLPTKLDSTVPTSTSATAAENIVNDANTGLSGFFVEVATERTNTITPTIDIDDVCSEPFSDEEWWAEAANSLDTDEFTKDSDQPLSESSSTASSPPPNKRARQSGSLLDFITRIVRPSTSRPSALSKSMHCWLS